MPRIIATWVTWDEPDRAVAVAQWKERDICVVFPLHWAAIMGQEPMIAHAKDRIASLEGKAGRTLAPGSVLLAFTRHVQIMRPGEMIDPDVSRAIMPGLNLG